MDGPGAVRAAIADRPDVWDIVTTYAAVTHLPDRVQPIADALALTIEQVNAAFAYHEGHREQIDARIADNAHLPKTCAVAHDAHDWSCDHGPEPASTLAPRSFARRCG